MWTKSREFSSKVQVCEQSSISLTVRVSPGQENAPFGKKDDLQLEIGREPGWLDGRYIGADYLTVRILVGEIDGPCTTAGAYIDYFLYYISVRGVFRAWK